METLLKSVNHRQLGRASKLPLVSLLQHAQKAGGVGGVGGGEEVKLVGEKKTIPIQVVSYRGVLSLTHSGRFLPCGRVSAGNQASIHVA